MSDSTKSRRTFLRATACGTAVVGAGGLAWLTANDPGDREEPGGLPRHDVVETGAKRARRVAAGRGGEIHVAADRGVLRFDARGVQVGEITLDRPARSLAIAEDGRVFVGQRDRVRVFDAAGAELDVLPSLGRDALVGGIAVGRENVYVADVTAGVVWRFDGEGRRRNVIAPAGGRFHVPAEFSSLEPAANDGVHVVHAGRHRIETYAADGERLGTWGRRSRTVEGFGGCCNPVGLARLGGDRFVTAERGRRQVKLFDEAGRFQGLLADTTEFGDDAATVHADEAAACHGRGLDVTVDDLGRVVVLDRETARLHVLGKTA